MILINSRKSPAYEDRDQSLIFCCGVIINEWHKALHYSDVIVGAMASQVTSVNIVYSTVYSGADERKHQGPRVSGLCEGIHRWPVNSPHKGPVTRKIVSIWCCHHEKKRLIRKVFISLFVIFLTVLLIACLMKLVYVKYCMYHTAYTKSWNVSIGLSMKHSIFAICRVIFFNYRYKSKWFNSIVVTAVRIYHRMSLISQLALNSLWYRKWQRLFKFCVIPLRFSLTIPWKCVIKIKILALVYYKVCNLKHEMLMTYFNRSLCFNNIISIIGIYLFHSL